LVGAIDVRDPLGWCDFEVASASERAAALLFIKHAQFRGASWASFGAQPSIKELAPTRINGRERKCLRAHGSSCRGKGKGKGNIVN